MASLTFKPYVDQENTVPVAKSHKAKHAGPLRVGKTFNKGVQKRVENTPRRALGDIINTGKTPGSGLQKPILKQDQLRKLNYKHGTSEKKEIKCNPTQKLEFKTEKKLEEVDEIETMHITKDNDHEDDYDDIWPKSERISTYITKLITWRPPCLYRSESEAEESEDEEEQHRKRMEDVDRIFESFPEPEIPDNIPYIDEADLIVPDPLENLTFESLESLDLDLDIKDISLRHLDDSLDISPSIGQLQIQDS